MAGSGQSNSADKKENFVKILIAGSDGAGKTSLLFRFLQDLAPDSIPTRTIGVNFIIFTHVKPYADNYRPTFYILDFVRSREIGIFKALYSRGTYGILFAFDVTSTESFEYCQANVEKYRKNAPEAFLLLLGNKVDLKEKRVVPPERGQALIESGAVDAYLETSATTNFQVQEAFNLVLSKAQEIHQHAKPAPILPSQPPPEAPQLLPKPQLRRDPEYTQPPRMLQGSPPGDENIVKLCLTGMPGAGKSTLLRQFLQNMTPDTSPTPAQSLHVTDFTIFKPVKPLDPNYNPTFQIWDCGGAARAYYLYPAYCKGARGILLVFNVTNAESFEYCQRTAGAYRKSAPDTFILLVGNKVDLKEKRVVPPEQAQALLKSGAVDAYLETSATANFQVQEAFNLVFSKVQEIHRLTKSAQSLLPESLPEASQLPPKPQVSRDAEKVQPAKALEGSPLGDESIVKIAVGGLEGVGISSLITQFLREGARDVVTSTRILVQNVTNFKSIKPFADNYYPTFQIWDCGSVHRMQFFFTMHCRGARGVVLVFDVTDAESFHFCEGNARDYRITAPETFLLLVGNKVDLKEKRVVPPEQGQALLESGVVDAYLETSATTNFQVQEAFNLVLSKAVLPPRVLEEGYPLDAPGDEILDSEDISIWARVITGETGEVHNQIVFKRNVGGANFAESVVTCLHLVVYVGSLDEIYSLSEKDPTLANLARSTEGRLANLPPEEHFFALKSYVAGIASAGLFALVAEGPQPGFNNQWHSQVIRALYRLDSSGHIFMNLKIPGDEGIALRRDIAQSQGATPEVLEQLVGNEDGGVRKTVAKNESVPLKVLSLLAQDRESYVREAVAGIKTAPSVVLAILAQDKNRYVRMRVASNPNTPPEVLLTLARDADQSIRKAVATNPNTPPGVLSILMQDENVSIREALAENENAAPEVLTILAQDKDWLVREILATNPNTPPEILAYLAGTSVGAQEGVAGNVNTPPAILVKLARVDEGEVRHRVAENPNTPPETLAYLAGDKQWPVRAAVAKNPNTPPDILARLVGDEEKWVRKAARLNKNAPPEVCTRGVELEKWD